MCVCVCVLMCVFALPEYMFINEGSSRFYGHLCMLNSTMGVCVPLCESFLMHVCLCVASLFVCIGRCNKRPCAAQGLMSGTCNKGQMLACCLWFFHRWHHAVCFHLLDYLSRLFQGLPFNLHLKPMELNMPRDQSLTDHSIPCRSAATGFDTELRDSNIVRISKNKSKFERLLGSP
jgi:hypothetical protein